MSNQENQSENESENESVNYYEMLTAEVATRTAKPIKRIDELTKQIEKARKKLADEVSTSTGLDGRIEKHNKRAGESIAESEESYNKFKAALRKLRNESQLSAEIITELRDNFIPRLKTELWEAGSDKKDAFENGMAAGRLVCKAAMGVIKDRVYCELDNLSSERESYGDAVSRIFKDHNIIYMGHGLVKKALHYVPGYPKDEVEDFRRVLAKDDIHG